jgi:hypothetical protein
MSFKVALIRKAAKWAPLGLVAWVANKQLKGIARLNAIGFDLDRRTAHVNTLLEGEPEPIDVRVSGYSIVQGGDTYYFVLQQAESNKTWLNTLFSKVTGRLWKIPVPPHYLHHFQLVAAVLAPVEAPAEVPPAAKA